MCARGQIALCVALVLLLWCVSAFAGEIGARRITVEVGQQISIPGRGIDKYSEGVEGVVDIRLSDDYSHFVVLGEKPGESTMLIFYEDGRQEEITFSVPDPGDRVPARDNIRLDFYFVELKSTNGYQVGVNWPASIGVDANLEVTLTPSGVSTASASLSGLPLPRLDVLQRSEWAKVFRHASLVAADGESAEFNSGGDFNIAIEGSNAAELRQIPFGTHVKVWPRLDEKSGRLELRVEAEVASLGEGQVPTRNRSRVSTVVNIEMNQGIVLAGLDASGRAHHKRGLPWLSQVPVLGSLFGTHGSRGESVQNVVFIVPSVVSVVGGKERRYLDEALRVYRQYSGQSDRRMHLHKGAP